MPPKDYDCAQNRLDRIFDQELCNWCKDPLKEIYRATLCRHCYDLKAKLKRAYRTYLDSKARSCTDMFLPERDYKIAVEMVEAAQSEARSYGALHERQVSNLDLEHEFGYLSRKLLKKDLYYRHANLFQCFSASQKQLLVYIISRMIREHDRRHRKDGAANCTDTLEETLRNRAEGTYRVEDDVKP